MTASGRHQAHDQLLALVQRTRQRLDALASRIEVLDDESDREALGTEHETLATRGQELMEEIRSWTEVEIGIPTSVENLEAAVDVLEADLDALNPPESATRAAAIDLQVKAWKRRVDWLRLQGALGAMEARDDLEGLTRRLDGVRGQVLVELQSTTEDSKDVVVDLRRDVEKVLIDVRRAVAKAASGLTTR